MKQMKRMKRFISVALILLTLLTFVPLTTSVSAAAAEPTIQVQWSSPWQNYWYGTCYGTGMSLWDSGCAIFAFSNSVWYLTGNKPSVTEVAQWAANSNYFNGSYGGGSVRGLFAGAYNAYGSRFGFTMAGEGSGWSQDLKNHLANGGVAIGNVPGHYIAIVGYNPQTDQFHIYDSAPGLNNATASNNGNVWVTEAQIYAGTNSTYGVTYYLNWYTKLSRTGAAPAWSITGPTAGDPTTELGENFYAQICNQSVNKNLAGAASSVSAKTKSDGAEQIWQFILQSDGETYKIMNTKTGTFLDVTGAASADGTPVGLYDSNTSDAQKWYVVAKNGAYVLQPACSPSSSLDINTQDKTSAIIWSYSEGENQQFQINLVAGPYADMGNSFVAKIYNSNKEKYLATELNKPLLQASSSKNTQNWTFTKNANGTYTIVNMSNGNALTAEKSGKTNGTKVVLSPNTSSASQQWYLYKVSGGYAIRPAHSLATAVDVDNVTYAHLWNYADGHQVQIFDIQKSKTSPAEEPLQSDFYATITFNGKNVTLNSASGTITGIAPDASNTKQIWHFVQRGDGSYKIMNDATGYCITLGSAEATEGELVKAWMDTGIAEQAWKVTKKDGKITIQPASDEALYLTVGADRKAKLEKTEASASILLANRNSSENLDAVFIANIGYNSNLHFTMSTNNEVITYGVTESDAQKWQFVRRADGTYQIINHKPEVANRYLNYSGSKAKHGATLTLGADASQSWYVFALNGGYVIQLAGTDLAVSVKGISSQAQEYVRLENFYGGTSQIFKLKKI